VSKDKVKKAEGIKYWTTALRLLPSATIYAPLGNMKHRYVHRKHIQPTWS
jgi:hypothetical protein